MAKPTNRNAESGEVRDRTISPQEKHDEGHHDEERGALHGPLGLLIDVDGLQQADADRGGVGPALELSGIHAGARPSWRIAAPTRARSSVR
jgi:hypothetical protein